MSRVLIGITVGLALVGGCSSGPDIRSDYDRDADFSSYQTYAFFEQTGMDRAGYTSLTSNHFKTAVRREMDALGYRYQVNDPDLLVNVFANAVEKTDVRSRPTATFSTGYYGYRGSFYGTFPLYGSEVDTIRYREGTATIDVVDAEKSTLVWEGTAEGRLSDEAMQNPKPAIDRVVELIFNEYPTASP